MEYCSTATGFNLISFFNHFVLKSRKIENNVKRGSPVHNMILTCKILQSFGAWIF
jgi:hypothetical protein